MKIPTITGIIRRRILANYRIDPDVVDSVLPYGFRPKLVRGNAIGGICLIRLEKIRPKGIVQFAGISSENSAHRFAVEWNDDDGHTREGVFIPRRDTDSRLNALAGGRVFPGVHYLSRFSVDDRGTAISLRVVAEDHDEPLVELEVEATDDFPATSIFDSLDEASNFFEQGRIGYSARPESLKLDGLRLEVENWQVSPLDARFIRSSFFGDTSIFPLGSFEFDHALLMRNIAHEWHTEPTVIAHKGRQA